MRLTYCLGLLMVLCLAGTASRAEAASLQAVLRHFGLGWGEGYHARPHAVHARGSSTFGAPPVKQGPYAFFPPHRSQVEGHAGPWHLQPAWPSAPPAEWADPSSGGSGWEGLEPEPLPSPPPEPDFSVP